MPRFDPSVLKLVDSPIGPLRIGAATALANMPDPEIRAKGLELLNVIPKGDDWTSGFVLLAESGRAEDLPFIIDTLYAVPVQTLDANTVHGIAWDTRPLTKIGKPEDAAPIMLWGYENTPCSLCRGRSVSWLIENRVAPEELLEECLDDCNEEIRMNALEAIWAL